MYWGSVFFRDPRDRESHETHVSKYITTHADIISRNTNNLGCELFMKAGNRIIGGYYSDLCSTAGLFVFVYFLNYITYLNLVQINQKDA